MSPGLCVFVFLAAVFCVQRGVSGLQPDSDQIIPPVLNP